MSFVGPHQPDACRANHAQSLRGGYPSVRLMPRNAPTKCPARRLTHDFSTGFRSSSASHHKEALADEPRRDKALASVWRISDLCTASCRCPGGVPLHDCRTPRRQGSHSTKGGDSGRRSDRTDRASAPNGRSCCRRSLGRQSTALAHAQATGWHTPAHKPNRPEVATCRRRIYLPPYPCGHMSLRAATSSCCLQHVRRLQSSSKAEQAKDVCRCARLIGRCSCHRRRGPSVLRRPAHGCHTLNAYSCAGLRGPLVRWRAAHGRGQRSY